MITLNHDFEPNTLIESMITFVQESLKTEHSVDNVSTIRMIYRGFLLDPAKTVSEVSHERANHTQCALNPEYPLVAIVQFTVALTNTAVRILLLHLLTLIARAQKPNALVLHPLQQVHHVLPLRHLRALHAALSLVLSHASLTYFTVEDAHVGSVSQQRANDVDMASPASAVKGCVFGLGIDVIHIDALVNVPKNESQRVLLAVVEEGVVELLRIINRSCRHRFIILLLHERIVVLLCTSRFHRVIGLLFG